MTDVLTQPSDEVTENSPEKQKVIDFRLEWLLRCYKLKNAERIANDLTIDWHYAVDLRSKCDDERLCMKILFGKL